MTAPKHGARIMSRMGDDSGSCDLVITRNLAEEEVLVYLRTGRRCENSKSTTILRRSVATFWYAKCNTCDLEMRCCVGH